MDQRKRHEDERIITRAFCLRILPPRWLRRWQHRGQLRACPAPCNYVRCPARRSCSGSLRRQRRVLSDCFRRSCTVHVELDPSPGFFASSRSEPLNRLRWDGRDFWYTHDGWILPPDSQGDGLGIVRSADERELYDHCVVVSGPTTLTITSGSPPDGTVGVNYGGAHTLKGHQYTGFPLSATGGVPSYTWSWAAAQDSSLPPGLQISDLYLGGGSTRCCLYVLIISGTPTVAGTYNVIVTVTDSGSPPAQTSADYAIAINP
jgi:hypothetical protein